MPIVYLISYLYIDVVYQKFDCLISLSSVMLLSFVDALLDQYATPLILKFVPPILNASLVTILAMFVICSTKTFCS